MPLHAHSVPAQVTQGKETKKRASIAEFFSFLLSFKSVVDRLLVVVVMPLSASSGCLLTF